MTTGLVSIDSDLARKRWIREGMIQGSTKSFWSPFTGTNKDSIVYVVNNEAASEGHTVVFDYRGNLTGKAVQGKNRAYGKGEEKRTFSDKVTLDRYRFPVDNGDKFDGKNIGDLTINEHSDSRRMLSDVWTRWKDQGLFDSAQGGLSTVTNGIQTPSHEINLGSTGLTWNALIEIERKLRTSQGFNIGGVRRPLEPFNYNENTPMWTFVIDAHMAAALRSEVLFQNIIKDSDVSGNKNRNIAGYIGRIGALAIVEAPSFFGQTISTTGDGGWSLHDNEVEMCGLRQYDTTNAAWTGEEGFDYDSALESVGFILGRGAFQFAMGKQPDYHWQKSEDFGITSESALEVWCEVRKCVYTQESGPKYKQAFVSGIDHGVISVRAESVPTPAT